MTMNPRAVTVVLQGGLGNQMFQYAAGRALAKRTGAELLVDLDEFWTPGSRRYYLACYGITGPFTDALPPVAHAVAKAHSFWGRASRRLWPERAAAQDLRSGIYRQPVFHFDEAFLRLSPPIKLIGYFQNELYFADVAPEIRDIFSVRVPTTPSFDAQLRRIRAAAWPVSIHVRRGDYVSDKTLAYHGICEETYYRRAMSIMASQCRAVPTYFIFGDDLTASRAMFGDAPDVFYVEGDNDRPWEDLALMAECRAHIIANSSFSWWGAWLNGKPDKCVIAPRHWFSRRQLRQKSTADLYCDGWIAI